MPNKLSKREVHFSGTGIWFREPPDFDLAIFSSRSYKFLIPYAESGEGFRGDARVGALAFPFVIFAEQGFVFFYLRFKFAKGFLAAGEEMFIDSGSVKCSGGKSQIQCESVFIFAGKFCKYGVKLHEIRRVRFQKNIQFFDGVFHLLFNGFAIFEILETDR